MGWQDRDYYREGRKSNDVISQVLAFFNSSYSLGTYRGIRVNVHITFFFAVAALFLFVTATEKTATDGMVRVIWTGRVMTLVFLCVIAHEFGHALACRAVGGFCDKILIWPLGGLAMCAPPRRIWPEFITVACGPLVNLALMMLAFLGLWLNFGREDAFSHLNLEFLWGIKPSGDGFEGFLTDLFLVNFALSLFNLCLIFYPFDVGQMIQILMSIKLGYTRSMRVATTLGIFFSIVVLIIGMYKGELLLLGVALFGFHECYKKGRYLEQQGDLDELEYEAANSRRKSREAKSWLQAWKERREVARRQYEREMLEKFNQDVDRILDKVREKGLHSLTKAEQRKLHEATERQRKVS